MEGHAAHIFHLVWLFEKKWMNRRIKTCFIIVETYEASEHEV